MAEFWKRQGLILAMIAELALVAVGEWFILPLVGLLIWSLWGLVVRARMVARGEFDWDWLWISLFFVSLSVGFGGGHTRVTAGKNKEDLQWKHVLRFASPWLYAKTSDKAELAGFRLGEKWDGGGDKCVAVGDGIWEFLKEGAGDVAEVAFTEVAQSEAGQVQTCVVFEGKKGWRRKRSPFTALSTEVATNRIVGILLVKWHGAHPKKERGAWLEFAEQFDLGGLGYWEAGKWWDERQSEGPTSFEWYAQKRGVVARTGPENKDEGAKKPRRRRLISAAWVWDREAGRDGGK